MIHILPKVVCLTVDLHKNLVQVPLPVRARPHPARSISTDFSTKNCAKPVPPEPNGLIGAAMCGRLRLRQNVETKPASGMNRTFSGNLLPPPDDQIDIYRIELKPKATAA